LPELKRVIALYGDHVVMKDTLADALSALFMEPAAGPEHPGAAPAAGATTDRARDALDHYSRAIDRLRSGDWAGFGTELDIMRHILENLSQQSDSR
jgi:uncharacterized membrane protein (UPF0182 family)